MKVFVVGCGRWGTLISWYLSEKKGMDVTLYGRKGSKNLEGLIKNRKNDFLELTEQIKISAELEKIKEADIVIISINSQGLSSFMQEIKPLSLKNKTFVLCMKGIEISTGRRLSQIVKENVDQTNKIAVWLGPGHVQEFYSGIPNCMVIDSEDRQIKQQLVDAFSSDLIRFYYGEDMLGNEIGAAAKNVIGIAAGMLDGKGLSTLKGALMSRGTREVARLIVKMGGKEISAYGLCHLGDYEATVFSKFSHNRAYGEKIIKGESFDELAEGYYTAKAIKELAEKYSVDMPICDCVYKILYEGADPDITLENLFHRSIKREFYK